MEKRVILAFILSFAVLYGFQALFSPPAPPPGSDVPPPVQNPDVPAPAPTSPPASNTASSITPARPATPPPAEDVRAEKPEEFTFESPLYTATVSNVGGVLKSYTLKAYTGGEGKPLELINPDVAAKVGWPLQLVTGEAALDETLAGAAFVGRRENEHHVTFEFSSGGVHARKILQFDPLKFEFSLETSLERDGKPISHSVAWQGDFGDQSIARDPLYRNAVYHADGDFTRVNVGSIEEPQNLTSILAGVEDQYFLAMFMSSGLPLQIKTQKEEYPVEGGDPVPNLFVSAAMTDGSPLRIYVGPKEREQLSRVDPQLASVIDYGMFEFIAKPLVYALLWIHSYIGNFGWAIIILTIIINLVLFPLRMKQQVSMQKMTKIQPHMKRLQDQYKKLKPTDPRRAQVQSEMMNLYKEHGVNPVGGCLPLLLQMPVMFGFYNALNYAIELRRAPWILWINDLSRYDPYYILPILMAVSMLAMTKLTPTTVDPAQAKIMMIMPVMMTALFIHVSSGLVLYWLMSNIAGIGQQLFINKYWAPPAETKGQARSKQKGPPEK
jgi:YidC/Oxa1 family membrane protein insertase